MYLLFVFRLTMFQWISVCFLMILSTYIEGDWIRLLPLLYLVFQSGVFDQNLKIVNYSIDF